MPQKQTNNQYRTTGSKALNPVAAFSFITYLYLQFVKKADNHSICFKMASNKSLASKASYLSNEFLKFMEMFDSSESSGEELDELVPLWHLYASKRQVSFHLMMD
jgi:hypothetical protein